jgi:excisionase family DNA binding protein
MTAAELQERVALTVQETAELLRCSDDGVYEAIQAGEFPVEVIRLGRRIVIPAAPVRRLLGIEEP